MTRVGPHLRVFQSLVAVAQQAIDLGVDIFQSFVLLHHCKNVITPSCEEIYAFRSMCDGRFKQLFAHGSFWLDLASHRRCSIDMLRQEMYLAKKLGFTHFVVHPGTIKSTKQESIETVARTINRVMRHEHHLTLVLENVAHGDHLIGSDFLDFAAVHKLLDVPERVSLCIDTAHAHAYGYRISTTQDVDAFMSFMATHIGLDIVGLLHLNDAHDHVGSKIDRHAPLGEGVLGVHGLQRFASHEVFAHVPIILELPTDGFDVIKRSVELANSWCQNIFP
jgi:deoxyribonuclease-4